MADSVQSPGLSATLAALSRGGVDFVVCGGVACIAHGVARSTTDLDCCVRLDDENLRRLVEVARSLGLRLRSPEPLEALADSVRRRAWIEEKGAQVATLVRDDSPFQVDVFLHYPVPYEDLAHDALRIEIAGVPVGVSSREHLLRAKRAVSPARKVDIRDIEDLEELARRERE